MIGIKHVLAGILSLVCHALPAQDREEILNYQSAIEVRIDGTLQVTETITVKSLQQAIQRGIFRTFPTIYRDAYGNRVKVGFTVQEILKDGQPEPYEVSAEGDYKIVRIGDPEVFLPRGNHTYTIYYTTNRQIGFFEDFDELYWNIIGPDWSFPILQAEARITLPPQASIIQFAGYAGAVGNDSCDCELEKIADHIVSVKLNKVLNPNEALTVAVAWPKGIIQEPTANEQRLRFLGDNSGILLALLGLILVVAYYFFAWRRVGVDPRRGGIYPIFEVPQNLEASAVRYIYKMGFDQTSFTVALVQLATKGIIRIEEAKRKFYLHLLTSGQEANLNAFEESIINALFPEGSTVIHLNQKEHKKIDGALKVLQAHLKAHYREGYFRLNQIWLAPGILLSVATVILVFVVTFPLRFEEERIFLILGTLVATFLAGIITTLATQIYHVVQGASFKMTTLLGNVLSLLFVLALPGFLIYQFGVTFEYGILLLFLVLAAINHLFFYLIKAPTPEGRQVMDEIEGFRMYLNAAEKPVIQAMNPPGLTPEVFEKYLPYALALGVGEAWGKSFEKSLKTYEQSPNSRTSYRPSWYAGSALATGSFTGLSKGLGSAFGNALYNSSSPPGSKSGSGGGGRSGGGGGGGGGGGW
ncbi:hypothetical protein ADIS_2652 [Lunatimonas lonarensis]|uniref:DUF2207 domain-containing protein n=1 Tax=Lunatimonas lonarensis TaxID=1232681 RepID=R7ZRJ7_9BACT|nr:DUF2207 domain-containing protein [Lunatimonas lonarensis]EON76781.1 hypothetical protein ADIS_2652 [Lunatimonas lonarensis]